MFSLQGTGTRGRRSCPIPSTGRSTCAYLLGPHALFGLFEDAFGRIALYGPPDLDEQQRTIDALSGHITRLKAQIEKLQAEATALPQLSTSPPELRTRSFASQRLTHLEPPAFAEHATLITELLKNGYTLKQAEAQFGTSLDPQDWAMICEAVAATEKGTVASGEQK